jgi:hypothetical protein
VSGAHIVVSGIELVLVGICVGLLTAAPIGPVNVVGADRLQPRPALRQACAVLAHRADLPALGPHRHHLADFLSHGHQSGRHTLGVAAIFGGLGSLIGGLDTNLEALLLVAAVMGGSLLWWLGLSELIATIRHRLTEGRLKLVNRAAGAVLLAFGLILVIGGVFRQIG